MDKSELVEEWLESASKDLTVCESLFEKKHYRPEDFNEDNYFAREILRTGIRIA